MSGNGKSVAIVAMGLSHRDYTIEAGVKAGDKIADEIWAINAMANIIRCDRAFIMDDLGRLGAVDGYRWVLSLPADLPVYTSNPSIYQNLDDYPLEVVVNALGMSYFNTTAAYAIGLAITEGFSSISLYGLDFTYPDNHAAESGRACVEFLLGIAVNRGIQIHVARSSTLLDTNVKNKFYGYDVPVSVTVEDGRYVVTKGNTQ